MYMKLCPNKLNKTWCMFRDGNNRVPLNFGHSRRRRKEKETRRQATERENNKKRRGEGE
jgi:hypothetical protein